MGSFARFVSIAVVSFALASCSGASSNTNTSTSSGGTNTTSNSAGGATTAAAPALPAMPTNLPSPPRPWEQLSPEERGRYMDQHVVPVMRTLLQGYDATRYAEVNCATCHGNNAREVHFHMPNGLPTLPPFGSAQSQAWMQRDPRMFSFMRERIVPVMAQLLGKQPYNPQTHQGFGCLGCHPSGQ